MEVHTHSFSQFNKGTFKLPDNLQCIYIIYVAWICSRFPDFILTSSHRGQTKLVRLSGISETSNTYTNTYTNVCVCISIHHNV